MLDLKLDLNNEVILPKGELDVLLGALHNLGYETIGPQIKHQVLQYGPIRSISDLPQGYSSIQDKATYRLEEGKHSRYFGITHGAQSWKQFIYPPRKELFTLTKQNGHWEQVVRAFLPG